jgi:hypothetical protein
VASRVRQRLLRDAVDGDADRRRDARDVPSRPQLDGEARSLCVLDERGDLLRRRQRRCDASRLVGAAKQPDRPTELIHAAATERLGGSQCLLGRRGVAAEHVAGTGDLQHHSGQAVSHEIVHVTRDLTALSEQRLLAEFTLGSLELRGQLRVARKPATEHPRKRNAHDPDGHGDLGRVLDDAHRYRSHRCKRAQRHRRPERRRPARRDEGEQRDLEEERLELSGALRRDNRDDDHDSQERERDVAPIGPEAKGRHRDRRESEIGSPPRVGERGEDGRAKRDGRNQTPQLVGLRRSLT